jgi:hypothetical protein
VRHWRTRSITQDLSDEVAVHRENYVILKLGTGRARERGVGFAVCITHFRGGHTAVFTDATCFEFAFKPKRVTATLIGRVSRYNSTT